MAAGIARGALALGAPGRIRVAVIDPNPIFRTGVVQAIARSEALLLVAEGATAANAQRALREAAPDLLFIDISHIGVQRRNRARYCQKLRPLPLVVLTALDPIVAPSKHYVGHLFKKMQVRNRIEARERLARDQRLPGRA